MRSLIKYIVCSFVFVTGCASEYSIVSPSLDITIPAEEPFEVPVKIPEHPIQEIEVPEIPEEPEEPPAFPDIEVTPLESELGSLDVLAAESFEQNFTISNVGDADLEILSISLEVNDGMFSLVDSEPRSIVPSDLSDFISIFHPDSSGAKEEYVIVESNDPDEPLIRVPLSGEGLAPQIEVDPMFYSYGTPLIGCPEELLIFIRNIGTTNLEVSRITYSYTPDLNFIIDEALYGEAPWTIFPGEELEAIATYEAYNEIYDLAYLTVESNDPLEPVVIATHEGDAVRAGTITDSFIQEETEEVDILFVIDNSCSMGDEQVDLATNAVSFITTLDASGADYRLATITTDSPNFIGPVLSLGYPDIVTEFEAQLVAGVSGSATEKGLEMAYQATDIGGDAESGGLFQRPNAVLSIVFVSDEDDWSTLSVDTHYVPWFQSLKISPDKVILHAIIDDPADAIYCGTGGYRYIDAAALTGGITSSICTDTWADDLETLADGSLVPNLDFPLNEIPLPESIEVAVNGMPVVAGWTYDGYSNSVVFTEPFAPEAGDLVEITYGYYSDCP